jgi:hypothetical protein
MIFTSIRHRLTVTFSIFVVLVLLGAIIGTYTWFRYHTRQMVLNEQSAMIASLAHTQDDRLAAAHKALIAVGAVAPKANLLKDSVAQLWLDDRVGIRTIFDHGLFIFDGTGKLIASSPISHNIMGKNYSHRPYFQETVRKRKPVISRPFVSTATAVPVIAMTTPLFDSAGNVIAVMAGFIELSKREVFLKS